MSPASPATEAPPTAPYVGPRPFERADAPVFFGRDAEADDLMCRIVAHPEVLFYSPSGAGKSSLLNAKLIPLLEAEGCEVFPQVRVRQTVPGVRPEAVSNVFVFHTLAAWAAGTDPARLVGLTLTDYLLGRDYQRDSDDATRPRVAIFDQFEEVFTAYPEHWQSRRPFFEQLGQALKDDPFLRVVLSMREDYIAALDPYARLLPDRLRTRFRLERLRRRGALDAIRRPLEQLAGARRAFTDRAAGALVDNLLEIQLPPEAGGGKVQGEFVEAVQLQVACQTLWQKLPADVTEIDEADLEKFGDVAQALGDFYDDAVGATARAKGVPEADLREWFTEKLITPAVTRALVYRGTDTTGGVPNAAVDELEGKYHLIRSEVRGGGARWYELSHDRFLKPVQDSNQKWLAARAGSRERLAEIRAQLGRWRADGTLLNEAEVVVAERWLVRPGAAELKEREGLDKLVKATKAKREADRDAAARKARRLRFTLYGMLGLLGLAVCGGLWALLERWDAVEARRKAETAQKDTLDATRTTEKLTRLLSADVILGKHRDDAKEAEARVENTPAESIGAIRDAIAEVRTLNPFGPGAALESITDPLLVGPRDGFVRRRNESRDQLQDVCRQALIRSRSAVARGVVAAPARVAFVRGREALVTVTHDGRVQLWHAGTGALLSQTPDLHRPRNQAPAAPFFAVSPAGDRVAVVGSMQDPARSQWTVTVWAVSVEEGTGKTVLAYKTRLQHDEESEVVSLAFTHDGRRMLTGCRDGSVWEWDAENGRVNEQPDTPKIKSALSAVACSPDLKVRVAAFSPGGEVIWWGAEKTVGEQLCKYDAVVTWVGITPDGRHIVTSGGAPDREGTTDVWDAADGRHVTSRPGMIRWAAFSPDGRWAVSPPRFGVPGRGAPPVVWEVRTAADRLSLFGHSTEVNQAAFSPDGRFLVTAGQDRRGLVWDAVTGVVLHDLAGHTQPVTGAAFAADGRVVTAGADFTARVWNLEPDTTVAALAGDRVTDAAVSRSGALVATACRDRTVRVWNAATGKTATLTGLATVATAVGFSSDDQLVVTGEAGGAVTVWNARTGDRVQDLTRHRATVTTAAFGQVKGDERVVLTAGWDHTARLSNADTGKEVDKYPHPAAVAAAAFTRDGKWVVTVGGDDRTRAWPRTPAGAGTADPTVVPGRPVNLAQVAGQESPLLVMNPPTQDDLMGQGGVRLWSLKPDRIMSYPFELEDNKAVTASAVSPDWTLAALGRPDGTVQVWDLTTRKLVHTLCGHKAQIIAAVFNRGGGRLVLATAAADGTAKVWDPRAGGPAKTTLYGISLIRDVPAVALAPDGTRVAAGVWEGRDFAAAVWDAATGEVVVNLRGLRDAATSCAFSPDGRRVAVATQDGGIRVWEVPSGNQLPAPEGHRGYVSRVEFNPAGDRLLSTSWDWTARVWDPATGATVAHLGYGFGSAPVVGFRDDGTLVTAGYGRRVLEWDAKNGSARPLLPPLPPIPPDPDRPSYYSPPGSQSFYSPSGDVVLLVGKERIARVWDVRAGRERAVLAGSSDRPVGVVFSPDGRRLLTTGTGAGGSVVWDTATGRRVADVDARPAPGRAAFSGNGSVLVTAARDGAVAWDAATGKVIWTLSGGGAEPTQVAVSRDGRFAAAADRSGSVGVWDLKTDGALQRGLRTHPEGVKALVLSNDGRLLATAGVHGSVRVWDWATGDAVRGPEPVPGGAIGLAFSPSGELVAALDQKSVARVWAVRDKAEPVVIKGIGHTAGVAGGSFAPDGRAVLTEGTDGSVRVWDATDGRLQTVLQPPGIPEGVAARARFTAEGTRVVTFWADDNNSSAGLWETATGKDLKTQEKAATERNPKLESAFRSDHLEVSPDGLLFLTNAQVRAKPRSPADATGPWLWNPAEPPNPAARPLQGGAPLLAAAAFSPQGDLLVTVGQGNTGPTLWAVRPGRTEVLTSLTGGHSTSVAGVDLSPDKKFLVTAGRDGTARVWDVSNPQRVLGVDVLPGSSNRSVVRAQFAPGSQSGRVLVVSEDAAARLYTCRLCGSLDDVLDIARQRVSNRQVGSAAPGKSD